MSSQKIKLHKGQTSLIKAFIKSFHFDSGNLVTNDYLEFEKLENDLLKISVFEAHFDRYQLGFFIQKLANKLLSNSHTDIVEKEKIFYSDSWLESCVSTVTATLESFPFEYDGSISLPACETEFPLDFDITANAFINTAAISSAPNSLAMALMSSGFSYWQTEQLSGITYLNIKVKGFFDGSVNSTAIDEFLSHLKQTLALAYIYTLISADKYSLDFDKNHRIASSNRTITPHWIMKAEVLNNEESVHVEVPPELAAFINTINFKCNDLKVITENPEAKTILGSIVEKKPEDAVEFNHAMAEKFQTIKTFFNLTDSSDKNRISASLEWFLNAKSTSNQSIALIYFCIGLEAILGDESTSKELQLKEKLADRVAYMIGKTNVERASLKEDFKAIYSARSDLVHAKESKISKRKSELLHTAEVMLSFLIRREIRGLIKSIN